DFEGISAGPQPGGECGEGGVIAMFLMTDQALNAFTNEDAFSLNAEADLTLADFSQRGQNRAEPEDVIIWSDVQGAFTDMAISVTGITRDEERIRRYYGEEVSAGDIIAGAVTTGRSNPLRDALTRM